MNILHTISSKWERSLREWNASSPTRRFDILYNIGKFGGNLIGVRFYGDCKLVWYSSSTGFIHLLYYTLATYTFIYHTLEGNFVDGLPCWSMSGLYFSSMFAYIDALSKRHEMNKSMLFVKKYLYNEEYDEICSKGINKTVRRWITTIGIIFASIIIGLIYPLYIWYRDGIFYTLAGVMIPFVEPNSNLDITINVISQTIVGIHAANGLIAIQNYLAIIMNSIETSSEICKSNIKELTVHLESGNASEALIRAYLTKIFKQIQRIDEYIVTVSDRHYWYFFLSSPSITYSIGLSIYAQYIMGFPPGYGIAIMSYVQMAITCYMGQIVVDRNDEICNALHSDLKWYLLPSQYQRDISLMINRMQNGVTLTIGPFQTLSYETLSILTQRILSFFMLLLNLREA